MAGVKGRFQPGQSGNPAGRKPGSVTQLKLRQAIARDLPEIIEAMVSKAKEGDTQAAKLLLDRTIPVLRPLDSPIVMGLGGTLAEDGRAILDAVGRGQLTPGQGGALLNGLASLARVVELDELVKRIEALEGASHGAH